MSVRFNQDATCLAVSSTDQTKLYYCDPPGRCYDGPGSIITEMLFSTSLIASIDMTQRQITITNTKKCSVICELTFPSAVINVAMNRKRVVVELTDQLMIYDVSNMKLIHTIHICNTKIALSPNDNSLLAYQHGPGQITLFDAINCKPIHHLQPHNTEIQLMTFSDDGELLATSSTKGTVIKVFDLHTHHLVNEFRRGSTRAAILSMALTSQLLVCSSSHSTVHFFQLNSNSNKFETASTKKYLPARVTSFLTPERHTACISLNDKSNIINNKGPTAVAIGSQNCYIATISELLTYSVRGEFISSFNLD